MKNVAVNDADVKDFIPAPLDGDTYEGFETLVDRANSWLEDVAGVVHVSLQSVLVQKGDRTSASLFLTKQLPVPRCMVDPFYAAMQLASVFACRRMAECGLLFTIVAF